MPELVLPAVDLHRSWLESRDEWGRDVHQAGSGLRPDDDVDSTGDFQTWVSRLHRGADETIPAEDGWVHATHWWIVEDHVYLGSISVRHSLNESLRRYGGHIGYGIRPSARRRGLASWALGAVLPEARSLGLDRVLITCHDQNLPSARVIESHGGVLEAVQHTEHGPTRRYWIDLATAAQS